MACNSKFSSKEKKKVAKYLRYQMVEAQVRYYKWCYYELNITMMNDLNYDCLEKQFDALAFELGLPGSWVDSRDQLVPELEVRPESLKQTIEFRSEEVRNA